MILELPRKQLGLAQRQKACLMIRLAHSGYLFSSMSEGLRWVRACVTIILRQTGGHTNVRW